MVTQSSPGARKYLDWVAVIIMMRMALMMTLMMPLMTTMAMTMTMTIKMMKVREK